MAFLRLTLISWTLLLSAWPCLAQLPVVPLQRFVSSTADFPSTIPGMEFRWKATDLTSNATVTLWPDEIQANNWVASGTITNRTNDVRFDGGNGGRGFVVTNVDITGTTNTFFLVFEPAGGIQAQLLDGTANSTGYAMHSDNHIYDEANSVDQTKQAISVGGAGTWQDWIQYNTNAAGGSLNSMGTATNGVIVATNSITGITHLGKVGTQNNGFSGYVGYISEFIIWTNTPPLTQSQITGLHNYRVTTYGP